MLSTPPSALIGGYPTGSDDFGSFSPCKTCRSNLFVRLPVPAATHQTSAGLSLPVSSRVLLSAAQLASLTPRQARLTLCCLCSGYINFTSVYIAWLSIAIFLHLPSFESLGIDFKTDLSLLFTVFLLSILVQVPPHRTSQWTLTNSGVHVASQLSFQNSGAHAACAQVLGIIHALHAVAVFFKVMAPSLYHPSYRAREMWSIVTLNSFNLAIACRQAPNPSLSQLEQMMGHQMGRYGSIQHQRS